MDAMIALLIIALVSVGLAFIAVIIWALAEQLGFKRVAKFFERLLDAI